jgi:hypothetical protein
VFRPVMFNVIIDVIRSKSIYQFVVYLSQMVFAFTFLFSCFVFWVVLRLELRVLCLLGRCSTTWITLPAPFAFFGLSFYDSFSLVFIDLFAWLWSNGPWFHDCSGLSYTCLIYVNLINKPNIVIIWHSFSLCFTKIQNIINYRHLDIQSITWNVFLLSHCNYKSFD